MNSAQQEEIDALRSLLVQCQQECNAVRIRFAALRGAVGGCLDACPFCSSNNCAMQSHKLLKEALEETAK